MKANRIVVTALLWSLVVGSSGPMAWANHADLVGGATNTKYSGKDASKKHSVTKPASDNDAIYGIDAGERSDDPCYLKVKFRDVTTGAESSKKYDKCSGNEGDMRYVTLPDGYFTVGVRVCLNNGGDKLKGIQLIGDHGGCLMGEKLIYTEQAPCSSVVKIGGSDYRLCNQNDPELVALDCKDNTTVTQYFERTNCQGSNRGPDSDWAKTVSCPSGQVATGMTLNTRDSGGGRRMANGISLVCHDLVEKP